MAEPGSDLRVRTLGTNRRARCTQRREWSTLEVSIGLVRRAVGLVSLLRAVPHKTGLRRGQISALAGVSRHPSGAF